MEYIKSFLKFVFTPVWYKEFVDSTIVEDENSSQNELGQFDIEERDIEDEKYQFIYIKYIFQSLCSKISNCFYMPSISYSMPPIQSTYSCKPKAILFGNFSQAFFKKFLSFIAALPKITFSTPASVYF